MMETTELRQWMVDTIAAVIDNSEPQYERLTNAARTAIMDMRHVDRVEYDNMLRGADFLFDRYHYTHAVGMAVRDELRDIFDEDIPEGFSRLILDSLLDLHSSQFVGMLGEHYLPESADDVWGEE
jgi:hypothetical protein